MKLFNKIFIVSAVFFIFFGVTTSVFAGAYNYTVQNVSGEKVNGLVTTNKDYYSPGETIYLTGTMQKAGTYSYPPYIEFTHGTISAYSNSTVYISGIHDNIIYLNAGGTPLSGTAQLTAPDVAGSYHVSWQISAFTATVPYSMPFTVIGTPPTVVNPTATSITTSSATLGAKVTSLGNPPTISARGICYSSVNTAPVLGQSGTTCVTATGTTIGEFNVSVSGLSAGTTYYYRGYATNAYMSGYTDSATFSTLSTSVILKLKPDNLKDLVNFKDLSTNGISHLAATVTNLPSGDCKLWMNTSEYSDTSYTNKSTDYYIDVSYLPQGVSEFKLVCTGGLGSNTVTVYGQSGTLSASTTSCIIPVGGSSCNIPSTWTTVSPQTDVTTWFNGGVPATSGDSGTDVDVVINGSGIMNTGSASGSTTLATYNRVDGESNGPSADNQLASLPINMSCAGGTWDGGKCFVNTVLISPDLQAGNPDWSGSAWTGQSKSVSSLITNFGQATTGSTTFYNLFQLGKLNTVGGNGSISRSSPSKTSILSSLIKKIKKVDAAENSDYTVIDNFVSSNSMSNLDVGESSVAYGMIAFPSEAGTYYIRACADKNSQASTGVIPESIEGNNCSAWIEVVTTTPTVLKPNLTAYKPSLSAGLIGSGSSTLSVVLNKSTKFYSTIVNNGSASTGKSFNNSFQVRTSSLGTPTSYTADPNPMTTLSAGATSVASKSITFSSVGNYEIRACADMPPTNPGVISELDEGDNCSDWVTVVVGGAPLPDLKISDIAPSAVPAGVSTTFYANISNEGEASAVSSNGKGFYNLLQWYSSSDPLGTIHDVTGSDMTATPLEVGGVAIFSRNIKFSELGTYMVRACADKSSASDVSGLVKESDETNNCSRNWAKILVEESVSPSGEITATGCDIDLNESKCDAKLNWVTYNPVGVSAVTTPTNTLVAEGNSGSTTHPVAHGTRDFYLYHNGILIAPVATALAKCVSGTIWDEDIGVCVESTITTGGEAKCDISTPFSCLQGEVQNKVEGSDYYSWDCVEGQDSVNCNYYYGGGVGTTSGVVTMKAVPSWIFKGRYSTLTWESWPGASCKISPDNVEVADSGSKQVYPSSSTVYNISCIDGEGTSGTAEATVRVIRPIIFEN